MTTVILVGGNDQTAPTHCIERLAREITMRVEAPHILSCNFAKSNADERTTSEVAWRERLEGEFPNSIVTIAAEGAWESQVDVADVIYLHGGESATLFKALPDFEKSRSLFSGKIVIGSSAGANYLAYGGYSPRTGRYLQGIGLVDVSILVHYGSSEMATMKVWREIHAQVAQKFQRPVLCVSEGEFTVVEV